MLHRIDWLEFTDVSEERSVLFTCYIQGVVILKKIRRQRVKFYITVTTRYPRHEMGVCGQLHARVALLPKKRDPLVFLKRTENAWWQYATLPSSPSRQLAVIWSLRQLRQYQNVIIQRAITVLSTASDAERPGVAGFQYGKATAQKRISNNTEFPSVKAVPWGRHAADLSPQRAGLHYGLVHRRLADTAAKGQVFFITIGLLLLPHVSMIGLLLRTNFSLNTPLIRSTRGRSSALSDTGGRCRSWLRHCATSRKVAGSIPVGVGIFHSHNPSGRTMALELSQPLTEMSTWNICWGVKAAGA
jgi:hypothetical protein